MTTWTLIAMALMPPLAIALMTPAVMAQHLSKIPFERLASAI